ncbi:MAG: serine/threonine-protein kinase [Eubacteriales bacterium]|nr:serine/threonine-protein kinase [Eubacteriales bacterium]
MDLTGKILKGRYCILEHIGSGGNGQLYLARDLELGCLWAVKEIPLSQKREAKLLRLLEHPAMPRMVDYVEKEEFCYLVMEYVRGKSLRQWLQEGRRFGTEELLEMAAAMVQVLGYLHGRKPPVYYGDLKPANLMLTPRGELYLVDFGSAVAGYFEGLALCQGTKEFAAPEQFQGRIGRSSDVYGFGKTMRALMGKRELVHYWRAPALWLFLRKCCQREEGKRYQTMEEAGEALEKIRKGMGKRRQAAAALLTWLSLLALLGVSLLGTERKPDFWQAFTEVTEIYYGEDMRGTDQEKKRQALERVEEGLHALLRSYTGEEEQSYLLRLLEANQDLKESLEEKQEGAG